MRHNGLYLCMTDVLLKTSFGINVCEFGTVSVSAEITCCDVIMLSALDLVALRQESY